MNAHALETQENAAADMVQQPKHYSSLDGSPIEAMDAVRAQLTKDQFAGWLHGNVAKYLWRYQLKGKPLEDLQKAQFLLAKLIDLHTPAD